MQPTANESLLLRWIRKTTTIKNNEVQAASLSFLFGFILMASYFVLRVPRDAMASDWSDKEVSILWTINFFAVTVLVALYGFVVARIEFRKIVPYIYLFFAASFVLFFVVVQSIADVVLINKGFYLWVSVFSLFNISVFWSAMSDTYNKEQASRLFAIIASGVSLGAVVGPLIPATLSQNLGVESMMLISAVMLLLPLPIIQRLRTLKISQLNNADLHADGDAVKIGGGSLKGFKEFFTNPYLLGIGLFIILYTGIGSFVYLEQKNLLAPYDVEVRATILGYRDFILNTLTYVLAFFVTGRLVKGAGMKVALPLMPILVVAGMLILAFSPILIVAVALHIISKAGNYALTRPAREMLFTLVSRESRFKTKPVIDIVAYRAGDVIWAWGFTGLTQGIGLGLGAVAAVGAGIAATWAVVGYFLGRHFDRSAAVDDSS